MPTLAALLDQVRDASGRGDLRAAARLMAEAARLAPDDADLAFAACTGLLEAGSAEAGALLPDLLQRFPRHAAGWERLGGVLARLGKPEAALACLRRAAAAAPGARLALACGRLLRQLGRPGEARTALEEAVALDPPCAPAHFLLGVLAQDAGDLPAAADAYGRALAADPGLAEAAVNLGTVLQEGGDLEAARRAYAAAVRRRPDTFGRIAQALSTSPRGELWLDLGRLRRSLAG